MINLLFAYVVLTILFITGIIVFRFLKPDKRLINGKILFVAPMLGFVVIMNIIEIANIVFPIKYVSYLVIGGIGIMTLAFHKWISYAFGILLKEKIFWLFSVMLCVLYAIPFLDKMELVSIQYFNNDIIYYLGNMEWLKEHNSLETVVYDEQHMLFWCAEYMLTHTRIGFDSFGAFLMSIFGLEAYQIFTSIGIVSILLMQCLVYYIENDILVVRGKALYLILAVVMLCANWSELLQLQYIPQMFGIVLLLASIAFTVKLFSYKNREDIFKKQWLLSLLISGLLAVYAEYASYIFVIYGIFVVGAVIVHKRWKGVMITSIRIMLLSVVLNPIGFYRCIKINSFVLENAGGDKANIDPYSGNMMTISNVFAKIFGLPISTNVTEEASWMLEIISMMFLLSALLVCGVFMRKIQNGYKYVLFGILLFFCLYEVYFRVSRYAYGEYKHLLGVSAIWLLFISFMFYKIIDQKRAFQWIGLSGGVILLGAALFKINIQYYSADLYYYDSKLMEIADVGDYLPSDEVIGISGDAATIHGEVYGLKDEEAVILTNNISYFPYADTPVTRYRLYEADISKMDNAEILWTNKRFTLVKNIGLQSAFYSGFHPFSSETNSIWTCEKESVICVTNFCDDKQLISLSFGTETAGEQKKELMVMLDGVVIAQAWSGEQIITDAFEINPGEVRKIYVYSIAEPDQYAGLTVGFKLTNYAMLQYETE